MQKRVRVLMLVRYMKECGGEMPWTRIESSEMIDSDYGFGSGRKITYSESIREALSQALNLDENVFVMGQGINDEIGMFGATTDLYKEFGENRVFDTPLAETGLMGVAVGAALGGLRPVYCHNRPDFLMLSMDQLVNHASKYNYMSGGICPIPLVVWAVTGQGWGSAAQHSQALQALFLHIPGIKIIMPTTPYDAKGLLLQAIADNNPVLFLDHRNIHNQIGNVPEEMYTIPLGKGIVRKQGKDITILGISSMLNESLKAAEVLQGKGIDAEVIDLRTIKPFDIDLIIASVTKTGRLLIADTGWKTGGISAEICTQVYERLHKDLKAPIIRVSLPDVPTTAAYTLEEAYYNYAKDIIERKEKCIRGC